MLPAVTAFYEVRKFSFEECNDLHITLRADVSTDQIAFAENANFLKAARWPMHRRSYFLLT
jgi:hypothetical protein